MWMCVALNPFGTEFCKFPREGSFFSKKANFGQKIYELQLQAAIFEMITNCGNSRPIGRRAEC